MILRKLAQNATKRHLQRSKYTCIYLGLRLEEAHQPWSKDRHEYYAVELLEHFVKVVLPLTIIRNIPNKGPMKHPRLQDFPTLGTLTSNVGDYYPEQARKNNKLRINALREQENEMLVDIWDGPEYMNEVNWPEKKLKKGYKTEMCFCILTRLRRKGSCGVVGLLKKMKRRNDKVIILDIKWDEKFIARDESEKQR